MIDMLALRSIKCPKILVIGNHAGIIQSILDFDYLSGKQEPSVICVIGAQQNFLRYFWGKSEILIPAYPELDSIDEATRERINLFAVAQSGRRAVEASEQVLMSAPGVLGGMVFAEGVPEQHALHLRTVAEAERKFVVGPASVGMSVAGSFKLGAIGGTLPEQIVRSGIIGSGGATAVISTSGGMINELMTMTTRAGSGISFAAAVGGERYPLTKPVELIEQAIKDDRTEAIVYFGELGGTDEYDIAELLKNNPTKKPIIAYIAGVVAEKFESAPQFGHAKAMAQNKSETSSAKKKVLRERGVIVADNFAQLEKLVNGLPKSRKIADVTALYESAVSIKYRSHALFIDRVSSDRGGDVKILGEPLVNYVAYRGLSEIALSMFLGKRPKSKRLIEFFDLCLKLLVDHGPQVSGAVNTMITARAGKDLTSALSSGLLTIGPRFGGAISQAANNWFEAVNGNELPHDFVERFVRNKQYIPGIGHKKYRLDNPDPRVMTLYKFFGSGGRYSKFAGEVESITTDKKAQLILNVDGAIAALLLDILKQDENYTNSEIESLIETEFCNAIFVYARTVGFIAHYLEQRRLDEGLFRLPDEYIFG